MLCYEVETPTKFFLKLLTVLSREEMEKAMTMLCSVWRAHNDFVWNNVMPCSYRVIGSALSFLLDWQEVRAPAVEQRVVRFKLWHAPSRGFVKVNVDAGFLANSLEMGAGMLIRDDKGVFISCRTIVHQGLMRVDDMEAWAVAVALRWVVSVGYSHVVVETDSR